MTIRSGARRPRPQAPRWRRRTAAAGLAVGLALTAAAIGGVPSAALAAPPGRPADKFACTRITNHGAVANDLGDDTAAIQRAINAAKGTPAKCVFVPSGTFRMTRFTIDGGVRMIGNRDNSVLYAPNAANRQVKLDGVGAGIYSLKLLTPGTKRTNDNEAIWIHHYASNWVVHDLTIDGGNGPGIITYGGFNGRITRNRLSNTKSDSIHISGGSHHIYIAGNKVRNSGDDNIAVVTYGYHPVNTYQVLIENNNVADQPWGRGITVVGGEHVTIRNNVITRTSDAGIYIAAESSWVTRGVKNVLVSRNRIDDCPSAHPEHGQPSIEVYSDNSFWIEDVLLDANTVTRGRNGPVRVRQRNTSNIACRGNTSDGAAIAPAYCGGDPYRVTGTTVTSALLGGDTEPLPN